MTRAEAPLDLQVQLRALFAEELDDGLVLLVRGLLGLERDAGATADAELLRELFRAAHSLKGAAHAAAVPEAANACERLESGLAAVRDGELSADAALVTRLLAETDALTALSARLHAGTAPPKVRTEAGAPQPSRTEAGAPQPVATATGQLAAVPPQAPSASLRVMADQVDVVLRQAGDGLAASRRLHEVVEQAAAIAEQVTAASARLRSALRLDSAPGADGLDTLLDDAARAATTLARTVEGTDRVLASATRGIAEAVQRLRTQPFAEACSSLDRVVRDIATAAGTPARFVLSGGDIDVDRSVIAGLRDPLLHLVRNAVDHGLEAPEVRAAAGKPVTGTVEVSAELNGSLLTVVVRDDGGGIDTGRLREAAARRGLPLPVDDVELALTPGLSSRSQVTAISGRGVGLDAARARLEQLGGSLRVESRPGAGTEIRLTSPVTLAVLRVLLVQAGRQVVALPTSSVDRVVQVERQELREADGAVLLRLGSRSVRAVSLADALAFGGGAAGGGGQDRLGVVVPRGGDVVLVTDGLLDELETAVQPVPERLAGAPGVLGVAVIAGGLPALVVNPVAVGRSASAFALQTGAAPSVASARILLAEDTVTTRALERSILEAAGYTVTVAVDGADAWRQLQTVEVDLVVSDVDMPEMSGIDLCRRIRASARLRELPVVLVTSLDSSADRQRGLEAGADGYVVKAELQQGTLLDTLARLL